MKLKTTFSGPENSGKRNSIFYYNDTSPTDELQEESSPESEENTIVENNPNSNDELSPDFQFISNEGPFLCGSLGTQYEISKKANRPDNLELVDEDGYPVRPPRRVKKKACEKRDQRLLSVPNIKLQKPDLQLLRDLRCKGEASTQAANQSSFAGSLMRRFSKSSLSLSLSLFCDLLILFGPLRFCLCVIFEVNNRFLVYSR